MRERDIHNLIEQEEAEAKQRIWARISSQLNLEPAPKQQPVAKKKAWKWATLAVALVCIVTLSIVLPLTLKGDDMRYCDNTQYKDEELNQTLKEYSIEHNNGFLYADWYGIAEEVNTSYGYIVGNKSDIVYFEEKFIANTGEELTFSVTDNKTQVDKFDKFYLDSETIVVNKINVLLNDINQTLWLGRFEHKGHTYYLQLKSDNGKARLVEIIEDMLK